MGRAVFTIDANVPRPTASAVSILGDIRNWDMMASSAVVTIPAAACAILTPLQATAAWQSSDTGALARLGKSAWTCPTPANWSEFHRRFNGDVYLDGMCDGAIVSDSSYSENQAWFVSMFMYATGNDARCCFAMAYNGITGTGYGLTFADVAVLVYTDGSVRIYKGSAMIGQGSLLPEKEKGDKQPVAQYGNGSGAVGSQWVDIMVLPINRRIAVVSSLGGVTIGALDVLDEADPNPTLTAAGELTIYAPTNPDATLQRMTVQVCPITYNTTGYLQSYPRAVDVSLVATPTYLRAISNLTRTGDGSTATASIDGTGIARRLRVTMTGDGTVTPVVAGAHAMWCFDATTPTETPTEFEIETLSMNWGKAGEGSCDVSITDTSEVLDATLYEVGNRGFKEEVDGVLMMEGYLDSPETHYDATWNGLTFNGKDLWSLFDKIRMMDPVPLDGLSFEAAITMLAACAGIPSIRVVADTSGYTLPVGKDAGNGEWAVQADAGQTVSEVMLRIKDDFAANWILTWRTEIISGAPVYSLVLINPISTPRTTAGTTRNLYTCAEALTAFPTMAGPIKLRDLKAKLQPPLANEIWVTGYDPIQMVRLQAVWRDTASQNPAGTKNSSWCGMIMLMGAADTAWQTQEAVNWVCEQIARQYGVAKVTAELTSDLLTDLIGTFQVPLAAGDVIRVRDVDYYFDARIESVSMQSELETTDIQWRDCIYKVVITQTVAVDPGGGLD